MFYFSTASAEQFLFVSEDIQELDVDENPTPSLEELLEEIQWT